MRCHRISFITEDVGNRPPMLMEGRERTQRALAGWLAGNPAAAAAADTEYVTRKLMVSEKKRELLYLENDSQYAYWSKARRALSEWVNMGVF